MFPKEKDWIPPWKRHFSIARAPNKSLHTDVQERRFAVFLHAGELKRTAPFSTHSVRYSFTTAHPVQFPYQHHHLHSPVHHQDNTPAAALLSTRSAIPSRNSSIVVLSPRPFYCSCNSVVVHFLQLSVFGGDCNFPLSFLRILK